MASNKVASKYTAEHRALIEPLWTQGVTAREIAERVNAKFGLTMTRNAIISLVDRWQLPKREQGGVWRIAGAEKRAQTMITNGGYTGGTKRAPSKPAPEAADEPTPLGAINEHADSGCRWIHGDVQVKFQFCAHAQTGQSPYCAFHTGRSKGQQPKPVQGGAYRSDRIR